VQWAGRSADAETTSEIFAIHRPNCSLHHPSHDRKSENTLQALVRVAERYQKVDEMDWSPLFVNSLYSYVENKSAYTKVKSTNGQEVIAKARPFDAKFRDGYKSSSMLWYESSGSPVLILNSLRNAAIVLGEMAKINPIHTGLQNTTKSIE